VAPPVSSYNRHHKEKKGSGGRELGSLVTEFAQVQGGFHREVVVDSGHLECRTWYRERWGPRGELGGAEGPADSGIRDFAGRGDSFEDPADSELNWTERPGELRRLSKFVRSDGTKCIVHSLSEARFSGGTGRDLAFQRAAACACGPPGFLASHSAVSSVSLAKVATLIPRYDGP
jgi:hypothetical protein